MGGARPAAPPHGQSWHTFLQNHTVWACDFLQTYDIWFRPLFAFFIVDINTKRVVLPSSSLTGGTVPSSENRLAR